MNNLLADRVFITIMGGEIRPINKMKNKKNITISVVKLSRKQSRDEEIAMHGKQITGRTHIQKSKKIYDRKKKGLIQEDT